MHHKLGVLVLVAALLLITGGVTLAQGGYDLSWWTADGGGYTFPGQVARTGSTGPGYWLGGTVGQPDAGVLTGPGYILTGGFWSGAAVTDVYQVYLPVILRTYP